MRGPITLMGKLGSLSSHVSAHTPKEPKCNMEFKSPGQLYRTLPQARGVERAWDMAPASKAVGTRTGSCGARTSGFSHCFLMWLCPSRSYACPGCGVIQP